MEEFKKVLLGINDSNELVVDVEGIYRAKLSSLLSSPVLAKYNGNPVSIPNENVAPLTFDNIEDETTELLDRSDLGAPKFLTVGLYIVIATAGTDSLTDPRKLTVQDVYTGSIGTFGETFLWEETHYFGATSVGLHLVVDDGIQPLLINIRNDDGINRDVSLAACQILKLI